MVVEPKESEGEGAISVPIANNSYLGHFFIYLHSLHVHFMEWSKHQIVPLTQS